jgi:hypothetical protein
MKRSFLLLLVATSLLIFKVSYAQTSHITDYSNVGAGNYGSTDIPIGTNTLIWASSLPSPTSFPEDMCINGQAEFTYSGRVKGTGSIIIAFWDNDPAVNPICSIDFFVASGQTAITVPFNCCAYFSTPVQGTFYWAEVRATTTLPGLINKFQNLGKTGYSTFANAVISVAWP